jgi:hypothetical protein
MKRSYFIRFFLIAALVVTAGVLYAQAPPPPPPRGQPGDQPVPVGSGLAILAALGAGYAAITWRRAQKKN